MSAEILREAARLMRKRAEATEHLTSPWSVGEWLDGYEIRYATDNPLAGDLAQCADYVSHPTAEHIASWHPTVAVAVADWLDAEADFADDPKNHAEPLPASLAAARAYLGSDS